MDDMDDVERSAKRRKTSGDGGVSSRSPSPLADAGLDMAALAAQAAETAIANLERNRAQAETLRSEQAASPDPDGDGGDGEQVDLSNIPSDPTEVALWVAKQISHFQTPGESSTLGQYHLDQSDAGLSGLTAIQAAAADEDEQARRRGENRERKKRWRESNAEKNKDNDLRCRINKRAKQIYGSHNSSDERRAWIESEFNKRRAKRESKERVRLAGGLPRGLTQSLTGGGSSSGGGGGGGGGGDDGSGAGLLLANALLGVGGDEAGPNPDAANALRAALEGGSVDARPFTEALKTMAANPDIMRGISAILGVSAPSDDEGEDDEGDDGGDDESIRDGEEGTAGEGEGEGEGESGEDQMVSALKAATAMLENGADPSQLGQAPDPHGDESTDTGPTGPMAGSGPDGGLDQAQMAALMALAGGDLPTTSGPSTTNADPSAGLSSDEDISTTLQRILAQVMARPPDAPGSSTSADETAALTSLLHTAAAGHARGGSAGLYRLAAARRSIDPARAARYGGTAAMNARFGRPATTPTPKAEGNSSEAGSLGKTEGAGTGKTEAGSGSEKESASGSGSGTQTPRADSAKARAFGFPPRPGKGLQRSRGGGSIGVGRGQTDSGAVGLERAEGEGVGV